MEHQHLEAAALERLLAVDRTLTQLAPDTTWISRFADTDKANETAAASGHAYRHGSSH